MKPNQRDSDAPARRKPVRARSASQKIEETVSRFERLTALRENALLEREKVIHLREESVLQREEQISQRESLAATSADASAESRLISLAQNDRNIRLKQANEKLVITSVQLQVATDEIEESRLAMTHIALHDLLTGLPNRNLFLDHLDQEIKKARRANRSLALMFLDLDGFKNVNDALGHAMGDLLLKETAERLKSCIREADTVARLGGDEFTLILTNVSNQRHVGSVAQHILNELAKPFSLENDKVTVSASIGITLYPEDATEIEELLKNADQAMYAAKQAGRNQYQYFTASMQEAAQARMRLINDLRVALENDQFEVFYQPMVELATGAIHKAEALIRWQHPSQGLINPAEFIPAAEDTGMITSFGDWVFHEAASQAARWRATYHTDFQISVNISPIQFKNEGFDLSEWFEHLRHLGLPGSAVVVEITEGLLLKASPAVADRLIAFRDAGIEVALDDFGTGYSALSYLKKFDIDYIKIDRVFIRNLPSDTDDMALCEAIIAMAHKLGIKVIAEGIETEAQRDWLAAAGCDHAQGYFFSEPLSAQGLEQLLETAPFEVQKTLRM